MWTARRPRRSCHFQQLFQVLPVTQLGSPPELLQCPCTAASAIFAKPNQMWPLPCLEPSPGTPGMGTLASSLSCGHTSLSSLTLALAVLLECPSLYPSLPGWLLQIWQSSAQTSPPERSSLRIPRRSPTSCLALVPVAAPGGQGHRAPAAGSCWCRVAARWMGWVQNSLPSQGTQGEVGATPASCPVQGPALHHSPGQAAPLAQQEPCSIRHPPSHQVNEKTHPHFMWPSAPPHHMLCLLSPQTNIVLRCN